MRNVLLIISYLFCVLCLVISDCKADFYLTNSGVNNNRISINSELGGWELLQEEDPFTDEMVYKICKSSDDRDTARNGSPISMAILCIEYKSNNNKLSAYIKDTCSFHVNPTCAIIRYGKNDPFSSLLDVDKSNVDETHFNLHGKSILDAILKDEKIVIKLENYNDTKQDRILMFSTKRNNFLEVSKPIIDKIK